jgi:hypothetical protein
MTWAEIADWWVRSLIVQYLIAAGLYAGGGMPWKALYFVSAAAISVAVLKMS